MSDCWTAIFDFISAKALSTALNEVIRLRPPRFRLRLEVKKWKILRSRDEILSRIAEVVGELTRIHECQRRELEKSINDRDLTLLLFLYKEEQVVNGLLRELRWVVYGEDS